MKLSMPCRAINKKKLGGCSRVVRGSPRRLEVVVGGGGGGGWGFG